MLLLNGGALPTLLRCRAEYGLAPEHLGRLARPRHMGKLRETLDAGFRVGIDNDAFSNWSLTKFAATIVRIEIALYGRCVTFNESMGPFARFAESTARVIWVRADASSAPVPPVGLGAEPMRLPRAAPLAAWPEGLLFVTVPDVPFDARATARRWSEWAPLMSHLPLALCVQDGAGDVGIPWNWPNLRCLFMAGSTEYKLSSEMAELCREGKRRGLYIHAGRVNTRKRIRYLLGLEGVVDSIDGTAFDRFRSTHLGWGLDEVAAETYQLQLPY